MFRRAHESGEETVMRLSSAAIILVAAVFYVFSVLFGTVSGLLRQLFPGRHLEA